MRSCHVGRTTTAGDARRAAVDWLEPRVLLAAQIVDRADFNGADGSAPVSGVYLDAQGNLFGTTSTGGASNVGVVFKLPAGKSTLQSSSFPSAPPFDGTTQISSLTLDPVTGNLVGVTAQGFHTGPNGTLFSVDPNTLAITTIAQFSDAAGVIAPFDVVADSAGNFWGLGFVENPDGRIFDALPVLWKVPAGSSVPQVVANFDLGSPSNIIIDSNNDLLGTANQGTMGAATVWELPAGSTTIQKLADFASVDPSAAAYGTPTLDATGDLFGRADEAPSGHGFLWEVAAGSRTVTLLAAFDGANGDRNSNGLVSSTSVLVTGGDLYGVAEGGGADDVGTVWRWNHLTAKIVKLADFRQNFGGPSGEVVSDINGNMFGVVGFSPRTGIDGAIWELPHAIGSTGGVPEVSAALSGSLPAAGVSGQPIVGFNEKLTVTNTGDGPDTGRFFVHYVLSTDRIFDASDLSLGTATTKTTLNPGKSFALSLSLKKLPSVAPGTYFVLAAASDPTGLTSTAVSATTITIAAPFIDLSGAIAAIPATAKAGKKANLSITVTNNGNFPANGPLALHLLASPSGVATDPANINLGTLAGKIKLSKLKPAGSKLYKIITILPPGLLPGAYFLIATLDPANVFVDTDRANNTLVSALTFTIVSP